MKSVLISIQPKWCELIASGKKTVEVRKTKPKIETPFKCYIYCTKDDKATFFSEEVFDGEKGKWAIPHVGNGKVIGEFVCDRIINIPYIMPYDIEDTSHPMRMDFIHETCVPDWKLDEYLGRKDGYGWHISDLVIYDKPKELSEFKGLRKTKFGYEPIKITRPPQSWCYVERLKGE